MRRLISELYYSPRAVTILIDSHPSLSERREARGRGVVYALSAAALFGVSAPLAKTLLHDASPQLLAGLLYLGSGIGLSIVAAIRRGDRRATEAPLARRDVPWLAGAILFGGAIGPVLLMIGLTRVPAASASLLLNLEGVFTALLAWIVFRENVDRRIALGMFAIVVGGLVLSWEGRADFGGLVGPLAVVGACLCWGIDNNLTQKVSGGDPVQVAMVRGLVAGTVNAALAATLGAHRPAVPILAGALLLGFFSYGVSLVLFVLALRHLGTARTGAYFSAAPFVGAAVAVVGFHERPTGLFAVGAACMALGVWLHLTEHHEHEHAHEALEHAHAHVHDEHHQHEHSPDDPPGEPHSHWHRHDPMVHRHPHYPDIHHRHSH
jgi:drug/metabolite transporter (DMT)-like permease